MISKPKQTKTSIARYVEITYGLTKEKSDEVVSGIFALISTSLKQGKPVLIPNIGLLSPVLKKGQEAYNFGKGKKKVPARVRIKFRQSRGFGKETKIKEFMKAIYSS